jgi:dihydroorotate dehydrogenase (fumarate)/dihydroorotate dehydrogenase
VYSTLARPVLFRMSAEQAHDLARVALRRGWLWVPADPMLRTGDPRLRTQLCGLDLASPVGLAPGLDKDGDLLGGLDHLGFGYITVGSITALPRDGNPRPRLVRYPDRLSIANSMGLPSVGVDAAIARLRVSRHRTPVIGSVCGFSADEVVSLARAVEPWVAAVEIGLICPNSTESDRMKSSEVFAELIGRLGQEHNKPVFVKLPSYASDEERTWVLSLVDACLAAGIEGLSVSGSRPVTESALAMGRGSLAGREVFPDSVKLVRDIAARVNGRIAIRAAGGVFSGADVASMLQAGATTVEVYSAFVYRGWGVAKELTRQLSTELDRRGVATSAELTPVSTEAA